MSQTFRALNFNQLIEVAFRTTFWSLKSKNDREEEKGIEYFHNAETMHQTFCRLWEKLKHSESLEIQMVPYLQLVGHKEHRLSFGYASDCFMEDMGTHASIHRAERVIQEKNGPLAVESTRQAHSLTLPSAQVGASLSNLEGES